MLLVFALYPRKISDRGAEDQNRAKAPSEYGTFASMFSKSNTPSPISIVMNTRALKQ